MFYQLFPSFLCSYLSQAFVCQLFEAPFPYLFSFYWYFLQLWQIALFFSFLLKGGGVKPNVLASFQYAWQQGICASASHTIFSIPVSPLVTDVFSGLCFFLSQSPLLPLGHFYPVIFKSLTASSTNINPISCANKNVPHVYRHVWYVPWQLSLHQVFVTATGVEPRKPNKHTCVPSLFYISTGLHPDDHTKTHLGRLLNQSCNISS